MLDIAPVFICYGDVSGNVLVPFALNGFIEVKVKFSVNDFPNFRIAIEFFTDRDAVSAVATVGREVFCRVCLKCLSVFSRGELVCDAGVLANVVAVSSNRFSCCMVGDEIVSLDAEQVVLCLPCLS